MEKYPDLMESKIISFDIETYDPNLIKKGTGVYREDGYILGVSIANDQGFSEYYNLCHEGIENDRKVKNLNYLTEVLGNHCPKLAVNALYDLDWLENGYDIKINGKWNDIQIAEPLLDEYRKSYSLDALAEKYLGRHKYKTEIDEFCENNKLRGDSRRHLYLMPYELVKKYAIEDVLLPLKIFTLQLEEMKKQNLIELYDMEMRLFPLLLQMRKTGVRINTTLLEEQTAKIGKEIEDLKEKIYTNWGEFNHNSSIQIAKVFENLGLECGKTEKGNPSADKKFLAGCRDEIAKDILEIRHKEKVYGTFLTNSFSNMLVGDRIHCTYFPMKSDKYGTKSGRFSSATPNLQQIPSDKNDPISRLCRELFISEDGHYWGKIDYSQVEYRLIAHYAQGPKSEEVRRQYNENPDTDYHQLIMDWTNTERKDAKRLNFGMAYAMGVNTCIDMFGWPREKAQQLIDRYHSVVPFVRFTRNNVGRVAKGRGYIRTILGRRARLSQLMRETRKEYTMFNRLIQGSAADIMKKAMVDCYESGIFDTLKPHLTVHDELDVSIPKTKEGIEAFTEMKRLMENTVNLRVPLVADAEIGFNWSDCTEERFLRFKKGEL